MMHFPTCFRFSSLLSENFRTLRKISPILLFPEKFLAEISDDLFLSSTTNFEFPPIFAVSVHFPLFRENYYSPLTLTNSPCFRQIHLLFTYFTFISFAPTLTMMHLCITQCTYLTPLAVVMVHCCE